MDMTVNQIQAGVDSAVMYGPTTDQAQSADGRQGRAWGLVDPVHGQMKLVHLAERGALKTDGMGAPSGL